MDFVTRLLTVSEKTRLTAKEAVRHPWILALNGSASSHTLARAVWNDGALSGEGGAGNSIANMLRFKEHDMLKRSASAPHIDFVHAPCVCMIQIDRPSTLALCMGQIYICGSNR